MSSFPRFIVPREQSAKPAKVAKEGTSNQDEPSKNSNFSSASSDADRNDIFISHHFPSMTIDQFEREAFALEIRVPELPETLWFVPTLEEAKTLVSDGINRGRIWTACELKDLMDIPGILSSQALSLAQIKLEFDGEVIEVRKKMTE